MGLGRDMDDMLLVCVNYDRAKFCTLDDYFESLKDEAKAAVKFGDNFKQVVAYAGQQNLSEILFIFGVKPVGQYKSAFGKKGRGTRLYDIRKVDGVLARAATYAMRTKCVIIPGNRRSCEKHSSGCAIAHNPIEF